MSITLDTFVFPATCDGLRWTDEFAWSPVAQSTGYGLTGALLVQESAKLAGRPMTLAGGRSGLRSYAWITRADFETLRALLILPNTPRTLIFHDRRRFTVIPRQDPFNVDPLPAVDDIGPNSPGAEWRYVVNELRFTILAEL